MSTELTVVYPIAVVVRGPRAWLGKEGLVLLTDELTDEVVVELEDTDDAGPAKYRVRMPSANVEIRTK